MAETIDSAVVGLLGAGNAGLENALIPSPKTTSDHDVAGTCRWPPAVPAGSRPWLSERLAAARAMLRACTMCELRCGADRTAGAGGPCGLGSATCEYKRYVSLNEQAGLVPALRVFWAGCNFRCRFCDEAPGAYRPAAGRRVVPETSAAEWAHAVAAGCRTISLLGGEPSLHVHTLLALAAASPRPLPIALNTNMYMTPAVLELLEPVVSLYLADFKFGNDACARQLSGVPRYLEVVCRNLERAAATTPLVVRHLLLPGHLECCFRPIVDWLSEHLPGCRFELYPGYVPCGPAGRDAVIGRLNTRGEVGRAREYLRGKPLAAGVPGTRRGRVAARRWPAGRGGSAGVTIGVDGRLYCHDLTPELDELLRALCSDCSPLAGACGS